MLKSGFWKLAAPGLLIIAAALATPSVAGDGADVVLGQANFTYNTANSPDARKLYNPQGVAIDASTTPNGLYVADRSNNRVLGYKDAATFVNGGPADLVIGQPDFYSTASNSGGTSGSSLYNPVGVAVDGSGNLYVADSGNNRVLEYNAPFAGCGSFPCVGGSANIVFGQADNLTSNTANNGGVSANSLNGPWGVAVDARGDLYVADYSNNRVLEYNTPLTSSTANMVFGQGGSFASNALNSGGLSANSLSGPIGVAVDASGDLYVADYSNNRVLEYDAPLTKGSMYLTQMRDGAGSTGIKWDGTLKARPFPRHFPASEREFTDGFGFGRLGVYPRVRGGTGWQAIGFWPDTGLSPRARGNRPSQPCPDPAPRSIPACAGEPGPLGWPGESFTVYPRVRGGT